MMSEYKISSADIAIRCDATIDDLIDVLEAKSRSYIPVIYALNKIDSISIEELDLIYRSPMRAPSVPSMAGISMSCLNRCGRS